MSRTKRWLVGAASAALLMGLGVPATSYADDAVEGTNYAGACEGDTGVTVVVDYQDLTGGAEVRCFIGDPEDGVEALRGAGFTMESPKPFLDTAVCRINGRPAADETVPLEEDPAYTEDCSKFPPANGYWSYYSSDDEGTTWEFSQNGIGGTDPKPGEWEGWSFSLNASASTNPEPRTDLALAPWLNADSTQAAADWIASQWDADADQFASGLADNIMALAAAKSHPDVVSEMVSAMVTAAPDYISGADSLAKVLIALDAAGQDTQHFLDCERDLTAELDQFIADKANSVNNWWGPHLVTIALNRLDKPVPQYVFDLLMDRQKDDGAFGYPDDTGLALSALVGITENSDNPQDMRNEATVAIDEVVAWSEDPDNRKTQDGNYYWTSFSPANSTGMLAGALADAGEDITSPQAFMRAQQKLTEVGAWSNKLNGTNANGMATTQGIFAVAGASIGTASLEVDRITSECSVKPAFTTQPNSTTVSAGDTATFTVVATGVPTPGITWEQELDGIWTAIKGVTGDTLTLDTVNNESNGLKVRAVAANSEGYAVSDIATLTVTPVVDTTVKPAFTTQPASTTVTAGGNATFTVAVTGDPTPGITWEQDVNGIWTAITGAAGNTLTLEKVTNESNGLKVRAVAANAAGFTVSTIATLTVKSAVIPPKEYPATLYNTPGYHKVNGREWFTTCEKYSQTQRCTTTIKATTVTYVNGRFVVSNDYAFNNLTYLPSPRALWKNNPLGGYGKVDAEVKWSTADGRKWRTVCDTAATGRDGCRTYATASVIETIKKPGQSNQYKWVTKEIFNSMVQFS